MIINALLSAFPTVASFYDFKENDREISRRAIPGIIKYAFNHSVIETNSEAAFVAFLEKNGNADYSRKLPAGLTFSDVLDTLSGNLSVNALIAQLEVTSRELSLPEIQAPMITRLKKRFVINTPKKRALLRILAFKLAQKHPVLNWHYDLLLQLPVSSENQIDTVQEAAGVTITFHLQGQGAIIVPADVAWLKSELSCCVEYLRLESRIHKKIMETIGATSFNLRAPKKPGPPDEPRLYNESIRNIMAIAHQMSARWLLSGHSSLQKKLIIIVHAGMMTEANPTIQQILEISLTAESGIYLTDFAHLCALYTYVKADYELYAQHPPRAAGYSGNIWSVNYFLSYSYYDYIPCLLKEKMLPRSIEDPSYEDFKQALHFPEHNGLNSFGALQAMQRFPKSVLLLTEIAKVLRARRMPFEADAVLTNLLLSYPLNLAARLMRMLVYLNTAQAQSDFHSANLAFERAEAEGDFIVRHCEPESEVWYEIGTLRFSRAMKYLKCLRDKNPAGKAKVQKADLLDQLEKARDAFLKSMTISPTGKFLNSLYLFIDTLCLIELFAAEEKPAGKKTKMPPIDIQGIFRSVCTSVFRNIGWLRDEAPMTGNNLEKVLQDFSLTLNRVIARNDNLLLCRSYIPFMKYVIAFSLWDFAPGGITPKICRLTLQLLEMARKEAEKLIEDNLYVYHVTDGHISADKFLLHIQDTIDIIHQHISDDDLKQEKDSPLIQAKLKDLSNIKLILLELDRSHTEPIILCN
jgi:hypothetical protein